MGNVVKEQKLLCHKDKETIVLGLFVNYHNLVIMGTLRIRMKQRTKKVEKV